MYRSNGRVHTWNMYINVHINYTYIHTLTTILEQLPIDIADALIVCRLDKAKLIIKLYNLVYVSSNGRMIF